jgi:hypothetical protein
MTKNFYRICVIVANCDVIEGKEVHYPNDFQISIECKRFLI